MSATLTVSLPGNLSPDLATLVKRSGKSYSQVVRVGLRRQIAIARFRDIRERLAQKAATVEILSGEDAFGVIS